jgi:hypothetical protein
MDGPSGDIYFRADGMGATKRQHQQRKKKKFFQETRGRQNASAIDTKIGRKFQEAHRRHKKWKRK